MSLLCNDINITMVTKARDILARFDHFSQELSSDLAQIAALVQQVTNKLQAFSSESSLLQTPV